MQQIQLSKMNRILQVTIMFQFIRKTTNYNSTCYTHCKYEPLN